MAQQISPLAQARFSRGGRVLLVDDEQTVLAAVRLWLEDAGWRVTCVQSTDEAMRAAQAIVFAIAIIDYRLQNGDDGIRLGRALHRDLGVPFILVSGYLNTSVVVDAMKSGALDVVDKPLARPRLLSLLEQATSVDQVREPSSSENHETAEVAWVELGIVTARWARMVLGACDARDDPRTVPLWGRVIGASAGTIEAICRLCDVKAHDARDLGRVLRALSKSRNGNILCRSHFAVADDRTLRGLFDRAGLDWDACAVPLQTFLFRQRFVEISRPCLRELAHLAANSRFF